MNRDTLLKSLKTCLKSVAKDPSSIEEAFDIFVYAIKDKTFQTQAEIADFFNEFETTPEASSFISQLFLTTSMSGSSILNDAIVSNNIPFIKYLLSRNEAKAIVAAVNPDSIMNLAYNKHEDLCHELLKLGFNINAKGSLRTARNRTICHYALAKEKSALFKRLITEYEDKIDYSLLDVDKRSLLHLAVQTNNLDAVEFLLLKGLTSIQKDLFGFTPLDIAMFNGNAEIAKILSNLSLVEIQKDPRWKNPPPMIDHGSMVKNMSDYLKLKYEAQDMPDVSFSVPKIHEGVCNGWSFLAPLYASDSLNRKSEFYQTCSTISKWDGKTESLSAKPTVYRETTGGLMEPEHANLDEMFFETTNHIYWFFHQSDASFGLPRHDRGSQVELVSKRRRIKRICEFGMFDMTKEEQEKVLSALREVADDTIIDTRSYEHTVSYYQKSKSEIFYFDPSIRYEVPSFENYSTALNNVSPYMLGKVSAFSYWHAHPENLDPHLQTKANAIVDKLIEELIVNNPIRSNQLSIIFKYAAYYDTPLFLERLLNHPHTKQVVNLDLLETLVETAHDRGNLDALETIYSHGYNMKNDDIDMLTSFLKAGILYQNTDLMTDVAKHIENKLREKSLPNESEIRRLLAFAESQKSKKPVSLTQQSESKQTVDVSQRKSIVFSCVTSPSAGLTPSSTENDQEVTSNKTLKKIPE